MAEKKKITPNKQKEAGIKMADALIEFVHMMYNINIAKNVVRAMQERLSERFDEFDGRRKGKV